MPVYFVALVTITDDKAYQPYVDGWVDIWMKHNINGEILVVDDEPQILEGGEWPSQRTVIIKFDSERDLEKWYLSEDYQTLAKHRRGASIANLALLKGFVMPEGLGS